MSDGETGKSKGPGGSGTTYGYTVEARFSYHEPAQIGGVLLDNRWREVKFTASTIGVPRGPRWNAAQFEQGGLVGYAAAQALRWWLHADAEANSVGGGVCLETRIVKHKLTYSYAVERVSDHGHIGGEDRSNCIPDWGKPDKGSVPARSPSEAVLLPI